eukprot:949957-Pelagomonas_calceolata.AAC.1
MEDKEAKALFKQTQKYTASKCFQPHGALAYSFTIRWRKRGKIAMQANVHLHEALPCTFTDEWRLQGKNAQVTNASNPMEPYHRALPICGGQNCTRRSLQRLFAHLGIHSELPVVEHPGGKGGKGRGKKGWLGTVALPPPFTPPSLLAYMQTFKQCVEPRTLSNCART